MWNELHYILCIVGYAIAGSLTWIYLLEKNTDLFQCRSGLPMTHVTPIYHILMSLEFADLILVSFVYFILREFPKNWYYPLVLHHVVVMITLCFSYTIHGHPYMFALLCSMNLFTPFWYVYRLFPNKTTYGIRGAAMHGRILCIGLTQLILIQHLFCMDDVESKVCSGVMTGLGFLFFIKVELPMYKAATVPYNNRKDT